MNLTNDAPKSGRERARGTDGDYPARLLDPRLFDWLDREFKRQRQRDKLNGEPDPDLKARWRSSPVFRAALYLRLACVEFERAGRDPGAGELMVDALYHYWRTQQ